MSFPLGPREKSRMVLQKEDIDYFEKGREDNITFWSRFDHKPQLNGATVMDVGCGHGRLCIDTALEGASRVIGLDVNPHLVRFAQENLKSRFSHLSDTVEFIHSDIQHYHQEMAFDYIISKDTFEHILDLNDVLREMEKRLKPGGSVYTGFGPLYYSSRGDHRRTKINIPWGHLIVPERIILKRLNRDRGDKVRTIEDLGLNKWRLRDYRKLFDESPLTVTFFQLRDNAHPLAGLCSMLRKLPFLEEYFSYNLYCVLKKPR